MRSTVLIPVSIFLCSALLATSASSETAGNGGRPFTVQLTGAAERPGPGDPNGSGTARLTINPGQGRVCYEITVSNIDAPTAGHIHEAPPTAPGPVVVPLFSGAGSTLSGCVPVDRALAMEIIKTPSDYYVNIHNPAFSAGAVRGQMAK